MGYCLLVSWLSPLLALVMFCFWFFGHFSVTQSLGISLLSFVGVVVFLKILLRMVTSAELRKLRAQIRLENPNLSEPEIQYSLSFQTGMATKSDETIAKALGDHYNRFLSEKGDHLEAVHATAHQVACAGILKVTGKFLFPDEHLQAAIRENDCLFEFYKGFVSSVKYGGSVPALWASGERVSRLLANPPKDTSDLLEMEAWEMEAVERKASEIRKLLSCQCPSCSDPVLPSR